MLRDTSGEDDDSNELSALGGTTRLVERPSRRRLPTLPYTPTSPTTRVSSLSQHSITPPPLSGFSSLTVEHAVHPWPGFDLAQIQDFSGLLSPLAMNPETYQTFDKTPLYVADSRRYSNAQLSVAPDAVQDYTQGRGEIHFTSTASPRISVAQEDGAPTVEDPNQAWYSFITQFKNV
jgi:hypothetical protein